MYRKKVIKKKFTKKDCQFCQGKSVADYKDGEKLRRFISERGRILPRAYTGVCAKHQRSLGVAIKRARHLAYLPFTSGL
ncbi:30S ribosomal protein S18 [Candidatus Gottesmanbacteria bacterium RIFCSPHIGHO2_01_FULL_42_12]|uniref:Small ribosomal subunit protein bS18 n=1 Tax=Candidatus Gottesmanbacteria bacterium RIFCSPHIGHO2_01_FULL_42_12 TaxID=1798377 RepID=A0A1F5Z000_9BACT|nr:MAG: 30S ribosomal protein S18 [Candidatus Gottesmanbacteria bacterium RIFCSPHIGHO2_01_FULL_42_12]